MLAPTLAAQAHTVSWLHTHKLAPLGGPAQDMLAQRQLVLEAKLVS